jgi:hypothetical protein
MITPLPPSPNLAFQDRVLLDTQDRYDAWDTGRDSPESAEDGDGLRITYDGTSRLPCVSILSADGAVELRGVHEIRAGCAALQKGLRLAEARRPPEPRRFRP